MQKVEQQKQQQQKFNRLVFGRIASNSGFEIVNVCLSFNIMLICLLQVFPGYGYEYKLCMFIDLDKMHWSAAFELVLWPDFSGISTC